MANPRIYLGIVPIASPPTPVGLPELLSIDPDNGSFITSEPITLIGTGFVAVSSVTFAGVEAEYTVVNRTTISAVPPRSSAGTVDVVVTTAAGSSGALSYTYTWPPAPQLTELLPDTGPAVGGQVVTLVGNGFVDLVDVLFDGMAIAFHVVDSSHIEIETPANASAATVPVVVSTLYGTSDAVEYTYDAPIPAPTLVEVNPTSGPTSGGNTITLTGTNFINVVSVSLAGAYVAFTVVNNTTITMSAPASTGGTVDIAVTTTSGTSEMLSYTYVAPAPAPTLLSATPSSGSFAGGQTVELTGTNFVSVQSVTFGGTAVDFTIINNTRLSVTTPAHAVGAADVVVTTATGTSGPVSFTYLMTTGNAYADAVLQDAPFLYYQFSDATPLDSSGNGRTPAYDAGLTFAAGEFVNLGNAVSLPGDGSKVTLGTVSPGLVVGGVVSIEAWIRPTEVRSWARVCDMGNGNGYDNLILARRADSNDLTLIGYNGTSQSGTLVAPGVIAPNAWTHVVGVITPTAMSIYANGVLVASGPGCVINTIVRYNSYIGASNWWFDAAYMGAIDEFALYSAELPPDRVAAHYAARQ